jgi:aconitate hydratase
LLGVQAVIAESFERIHRSNLIALGVAPLLFSQGEGWRALGLTGAERFTLRGLDEMRAHGASVWATATSADGRIIRFEAKPALDSQSERACLAAGGMFATIKDALMAQQGSLS